MLKDIVSAQKPFFEPGAHTELRAQVNRNRGVTLLSGNLTRNVRSDASGVCARVYENGVYGFSSRPGYDEQSVKSVLKAASENAGFMSAHAGRAERTLPSLGSGEIRVKEDIADAQQAKYIDFLRAMDDYILKFKDLAGRTLSLRADVMEKVLSVSDGYDSHSIMQRCYMYVVLTANTPAGAPVEVTDVYGAESFGGFEMNFTSPEVLFPKLDELYEKLMQKREGVYADAGEKICILGGDLAGMLSHEAVGHTTEADLVLGGSVAGHCVNKRVASELVTLVDFAHTALGKTVPLPIYVDDEGTKAEDVVIIEDGVLKNFMHSRETARRFDAKPLGNARAYAFNDEPLIRMRNTAILPGKSKLEDMIASVDDGYYLIDTNNGQADTTGEFMFGICMGYEIKHGKLGRALLDTTISGVAFEMLKTVDMLSSDMKWTCSGFCGKKQPMPVGMGGPAVRCKVMIGGR